MSEYRKQTAFLKALLRYEDSAECRDLSERLLASEKNERCLLCACRLVAVVALLGFAGIGYSAVLLPQFFDNATHVVVQFFSALGLGSLMCLSVFLSIWYWYRRSMNQIHQECRNVIQNMLEARLAANVSTSFPVTEPSAVHILVTTTSAACSFPHGTDFWSLPKAS
jgi:hypothetical protein